MRDDCRGWGTEDITLEEHSTYEAGHAVMYYLLDEGKATDFVPLDRSIMQPPFPGVRAEPHSMEWGALTGNLGSMLTGAQVLLAGWIAQHEPPDSTRDLDLKAIRVRRARHLLTAYAEEYVSDDDLALRDRAAAEWLTQMHETVRGHIHAAWPAVVALADTIRTQGKTLDKQQVYALIRTTLRRR